MSARASSGSLAPLYTLLALILFPALLPAPALGQEGEGQVRLPLTAFQALADRAAERKAAPQPPPLQATVSQAEVQVVVPAEPGRPARVKAQLTVHHLGSDWTAVPLLPVGTALASATEAGQPIALGSLDGKLVWSVRDSGNHRLDLEYAVAANRSEEGGSLDLSVPVAAALNLSVSLPGNGMRVSVMPASGFDVVEQGPLTVVTASVPQTAAVQVSWSLAAEKPSLIIGARYSGRLKGDMVHWNSEVSIKVLDTGPVTIPLVDAGVALAEAKLDGRTAVVREVGGKLAIELMGVGVHVLALSFQTPVSSEGGPPGTGFWLPRPPLASFRLDLPGDQELSVSPRAGIDLKRQGGRTVADVHLPPSDRVRFSWSEALPAAVQEQLQSNAEVYHLVEAQEGVLKVAALVAFQVTRGRTNLLRATLPKGVAVNQVSGEGVSDWRVVGAGERQLLTLYLDRQLAGELQVRVEFERLLGSAQPGSAAPVAIPLMVPSDTHRQRGMVALLSGSELSMRPEQSTGMNKVGENQLPTWVRSTIRRTVAHTYKYIDPQASLAVALAPPERQQGKFDATVDTLYSVGDGVMKASASVEIAIKSGRLMELMLALPADVNLVGVTAPSLRDHEVSEPGQDQGRSLRLMFTQEMEGTLRVEVFFERVLAGGQESLLIPAIHVPGADMEQGKLAVEALTAVEVQTAEAKRVLPLDVQELPRQLTLRTTNPILLAYKYVHAEPPFQLVLEVKHHAEMQVQVAAIDRADYQTLYTRHGLALTRAVYQLRNRRKQFLKVLLPARSELWSAGLNGRPVKPASSDEESVVLVPLVNSAAGFQVEIVYATRIDPLGFAGWIDGLLPVPDIVETSSSWEVFLPGELRYGRPDSNMSILAGGLEVEVDSARSTAFQQALSSQAPDALAPAGAADGAEGQGREEFKRSAGVLPLRIEVPRKGTLLRFEKLFANRGEERSRFSVRYAAPAAVSAGGLVLALGVFALIWVLAGLLLHRRAGASRKEWLVGLGALTGILLSATLLEPSAWWALAAGLAAAIILALRFFLSPHGALRAGWKAGRDSAGLEG